MPTMEKNSFIVWTMRPNIRDWTDVSHSAIASRSSGRIHGAATRMRRTSRSSGQLDVLDAAGPLVQRARQAVERPTAAAPG